MMFHDTHFHLDLVTNPEEVIAQVEASRIYTIAVTNSPTVFFHTNKLTQHCKYIRASLGLHPELAFERHKEITKFSELIDQTRYIGEIGMDNQKKSIQDYAMQKSVFEKIISLCAEKKNKILTIHSRKAEKDVISIIGSSFPGKVILHWYSGGIQNLETAIDYGFYFSVNYPMTKSLNGKKIIEALPNNRILIETDGPFTEYLGKPATPLITRLIVDEICAIKSKTKKPISTESIENNFKELLK